ncbi:MAG: YceI family protein [Planctomycetes bacterium]|nr:YceI family protein [Planctomycetota bacterium]
MRALTTLLPVMLLGILLVAGCSDPLANYAKANASDAKEVTHEKGKEFTFSNEGSKIGFHGAKVTGSHKGGFKKFSGKVILSDTGTTIKQVEVEIEMSSIWTDDPDKDNEKLTGHLKTGDFFLVEEHPKSKFISTEIKEGGEGGTHTVTGNLTMRGTTKSISFPATIKVSNDSVTTTAEFKINRHDWKVSFKGREDDLIKDDVGLTLNISAK